LSTFRPRGDEGGDASNPTYRVHAFYFQEAKALLNRRLTPRRQGLLSRPALLGRVSARVEDDELVQVSLQGPSTDPVPNASAGEMRVPSSSGRSLTEGGPPTSKT
jgi:hypothetical protein